MMVLMVDVLIENHFIMKVYSNLLLKATYVFVQKPWTLIFGSE